MQFSVLGPIEMSAGGRNVVPTASKPRRVIALLVMRRNTVVQTAELIDELWEDDPPTSAMTTLQTYIYKLRKILVENGADGLLSTRPGGYQLSLPDDATDLAAAEKAARAGQAHLERGDAVAARETLARALAIWRGPTLIDVVQGWLLSSYVTRLEEFRLRTRELRIEADLRLGRHRELISELKSLVVTQPLHEHLHASLMIALHRSGRRHEALEVFRVLRASMIEDLGIEPGREIKRLHQTLLRDTPIEEPDAADAVDLLPGSARAGTSRPGDAPSVTLRAPTGTPPAPPRPAADAPRPAAGHPGRPLPAAYPPQPARQGTPAVRSRDGAVPAARAPRAVNGHPAQPAEVVRPAQVVQPAPSVQPAQVVQAARRPAVTARLRTNGPEPTTPVAAMPVTAPAQLSADIADFTGRRELVNRLTAGLADADRASRTAPLVAVVTGAPGTGKTALSVHVAHQLRPRFDDGQLYAELHGSTGTDWDAAETLHGFLRALGVPAAQIPDGLAERSKLFRSATAGRRLLIVLDDTPSLGDVSPLLPGDPACAVIITGRRRLHGLATAWNIELDVLDHAESIQLLGRLIGPERLERERAAADRLVEFVGRLPLAVRCIGGRLTTLSHLPLATLADQLAGSGRVLDDLRVGDLDVRSCYDTSYAGLGRLEQGIYRLLSMLPVSEFTAGMGAELLGWETATMRRFLERLVEENLIKVARYDDAEIRYAFPGVSQLYARDCLTSTLAGGYLGDQVPRLQASEAFHLGASPNGRLPYHDPAPSRSGVPR